MVQLQASYTPLDLFAYRPEMARLRQGCAAINQPADIAKALLAFLLTKRRLHDSPDAGERSLAEQIDPEPHVEELW